MKKLLIAAAALAALPAFATTYNYAAVAQAQVGTAQANFSSISVDDSTMTLTASVTTNVDFNGANGLTLQCCSLFSTYPSTALTFQAGPVAAGSYNYSIDLSQDSSWNASFLAANGGTAASSFAALLAGLNGNIGAVEAWSGSQGLIGRITAAAPVPEPATYGMMALGLGLLALRRRKQQD